MASIRVPPHLLASLSTQSNKVNMGLRFSNGSDLEPWRCRRIDGKKWRCAKEAAPDQRYCERHVRKTRSRSRKPVEATHIKDNPSFLSAANQQPECSEWLMKNAGFGNFSLALMGQICHNLEDIVLTGLHGITDSGLSSLIKNCESGLTKIDLSGCVNLTDKIVSEISMVHGGTLEVLNLDGCKSITDASVVTIAKNCFSLRELNVSKSAITGFSVAALACSNQVNLQVLSLSGCQVSNKSLPFLKKLGETLIGLNMMQCRGVSGSAVGLLGEQIWKCDILV